MQSGNIDEILLVVHCKTEALRFTGKQFDLLFCQTHLVQCQASTAQLPLVY